MLLDLTRRHTLLVAVLLAAAPVASAAEVQIVPHVVQPGLECRGHLLAQSGCADGSCTATRRLPLTGAHAIDVRDTAWVITLQSENCWAAATEVQAGGEARREIDLWPLSAVHGSIAESIEKSVTPKVVRARVTTPPGSDRMIVAELDCPVARGRWTCAAPATVIDVRLQRDGFLPVYRWDLKPGLDAPVDAGAIQFARGAAIVGWATIPSRTKTETTVELASQGGVAVSLTRANARGFFQFAGIEPGRYDVTARAHGWSPATARDVKVGSGEEHLLREPLALEPLASLSVTIVPAVAPDRGPWHITLSRPSPLASSFRIMRQERVHESGFWAAHALEAERYRLTIRDSRGSTFATRDVDVRPPSSSEYVTIHAVRISGRVTAGDDPVQSTLTFRDGGFRVQVVTDDDGRFAGSLPHAGSWGLEIDLSGAMLRSRQVAIDATDDGESEPLLISLPGGRIAGAVVDEAGRPHAAMIRVSIGGSVKAYVRTGADGKFSLTALPAERVTIEADAGDDGATSVSRDLSEESDEELSLVLERRRNVAVRLLTPEGRPVSGAIVWQLLPPHWRRIEKRTDREGTVELWVPNAGNVDAVIFAAGFPLELLSLERRVKNGVAIALPRAGGRIRFNASGSRWPFIAPEGGSFFPVASLFFLPAAGGLPHGFSESGFAPDLAPGTYTICPTAVVNADCERHVLKPGMSIHSAVRPSTEKP